MNNLDSKSKIEIEKKIKKNQTKIKNGEGLIRTRNGECFEVQAERQENKFSD